LIVENLANLDKIKSSKFHLVVLPLKLKNAQVRPLGLLRLLINS